MTNIEWTQRPGTKGESWNPVIGCRHVAEGCRNCYAETMSKRLAAMGQTDYAAILDDKGKFNGKAVTRPETLDKPLRWRKPRTVFVNSMSDLFHEDVPFEFIAAVYGVMAACPQHTFIVLTKRPERMLEFFEWAAREDVIGEGVNAAVTEMFGHEGPREYLLREYPDDVEDAEFSGHVSDELVCNPPEWPLPNVWHGTSIANQKDADRNIPIILQVPSAVRFISAEPLVGPVDLSHPNPALLIYREAATVTVHCVDGTPSGPHNTYKRPGRGYGRYDGTGLDWVIVGGESGPGARPCDIAWIRSIIQQCKAAGVPVFVKQLGARPRLPFYDDNDDREIALSRLHTVIEDGREWDEHHQPNLDSLIEWKPDDKKGGDPSEWPEDLRVREYPAAK